VRGRSGSSSVAGIEASRTTTSNAQRRPGFSPQSQTSSGPLDLQTPGQRFPTTGAPIRNFDKSFPEIYVHLQIFTDSSPLLVFCGDNVLSSRTGGANCAAKVSRLLACSSADFHWPTCRGISRKKESALDFDGFPNTVKPPLCYRPEEGRCWSP
jgi:hypothetical protein